MNATDQARDWIIQHLASNNNYPLLSTFYCTDPYFNDKDNPPQFQPITTKLLTITTLKNKLKYTPYNNLIQLIQTNNIFPSYHTLYPALSNEQLKMTPKQKSDLSQWVARLFKNEIELKVQIILSSNYWRTNYIQHKKLNDQLLHETHYKNLSTHNPFIPSESVIKFIAHCANGMDYIRRTHQQLDYLGQQCTKPNINLNNNNDSSVKKINQFLNKHKYQSFKQTILSALDVAQNQVCSKGKDFLTRLSKADIQKIINNNSSRTPSPFKTRNITSIPSPPQQSQLQTEPPSQLPSQQIQTQIQLPQQPSPEVEVLNTVFPPTKYGLRTVVDVEIHGNWCSGTIIKRFNDGSVKIALHQEDMDENGKYKYDTHLKMKNLSKVVHCINEDGEYEIDDNPKLAIDISATKQVEFSSPIKQEEIRQEKEQLSQQLSQQMEISVNMLKDMPILPFTQVLENRNRNKKDVDENVMRNLENELSSMDMDEHDDDDHDNENEQHDEKDEKEDQRIIEAMGTSAIASQSSDITEPNLSAQLSPNTIKKKRNERTQQFKVTSSGNKRRSPSPRRRNKKRNRQEFEKKNAAHDSNTQKRRKIQTRSVTASKKKDITPRRQSQRLLARRNSENDKEKDKGKRKKKIQTTIGGTKDKKMTVNRGKNRNKNVKDNEVDSEGEEQQWSDDMSEGMKKLNEISKGDEIKNKRRKPKSKWTKEQEEALKKCYLKHDKARQLVKNYAIWDQIKRDSDYCHHWTNRTATSLRDKTRVLFDLNKSKKD